MRSDSPEWHRFWAGHLPANGAGWLRTDSPDTALQIQAERPVPSGQCLDLKDKQNSPGMEVHPMIPLWGNRLQLQKFLYHCSLGACNRDRKSRWGSAGHLPEQEQKSLRPFIIGRLTRNKQEPNPTDRSVYTWLTRLGVGDSFKNEQFPKCVWALASLHSMLMWTHGKTKAENVSQALSWMI